MKSKTFLCSLTFRIALPAFLSFGVHQAKAANPAPIPSVFSTELSQHKKSLFFEENKGQLADENGKLLSGIKYYGHTQGLNLYCKPGMISFVFTKAVRMDPFGKNEPEQISEASGLAERETEGERGGNVSVSRLDFVLIGSNLKAQITASRRQTYFENFYTSGDSDHGITSVHTYKTVTYKNIYADIDMILTTKGQSLEYSFLIHPGGNVNDIKLRWDGAESVQNIENGGARYENSLGRIEEGALTTYSGGKKIQSNFIRKSEGYGFKVEHYHKTKDLLIDPTLIWATYYGGENYDYGTGMTTDQQNSIYVIGFTNSYVGIATSGAWQTSLSGINGAYNGYLAKFNTSGKLIWGTYLWYFNNYYYYGNGISADNAGGVFLVGPTNNTTTNIATSGAWQTRPSDMFVARFTDKGFIDWATYFGGSSDRAFGSKCDNFGNLYVTGYTSGYPGMVTSGAYKTQISGGYDIFLAKFSTKGNLKWGTYYGGNGTEQGSGVSIDSSGNIYLSGVTSSQNGIATSGAYETSMTSGLSSASFLAKFDSSGSNLIWGTYFGDQYYYYYYYNYYYNGVSVDRSTGDVFIIGSTNGPYGLATTGAYQTSNAGSSDVFLAKFSSSGGYKWGTYYGGNENDYGYSVSSDNHGNVFIAGVSYSFKGIATSDGYQTKNISSPTYPSVFLARFTNSGKLDWGTYFGNSFYSYAYSSYVSTDVFGNAYLYGTTSDTSIATSGAYQTSFGGAYDTYIAKFGVKVKYDAGLHSIVDVGNNNCTDSEIVRVQLLNYGDTVLDSVKIFIAVNGKFQKELNWYGDLRPDSSVLVDLGNVRFIHKVDTVKAWTSLPDGYKDSVPTNDTIMVIDTVYKFPYAITGLSQSMCKGNKISLGDPPITGHTYSWLSIPSGFSSSVSNPTVSPSVTTTYYLTEVIDNTGCYKIDSAKIIVNPPPVPFISPINTICQGSSASIGHAAVTGDTYNWISVPAGFFSATSQNTVSPSLSTFYYLTETITATGCNTRDSALVIVHPSPPAKTIFSQAICQGDSIAIGYAPNIGDTYQWTSSPTGFQDTLSNPYVKPKNATEYILKETNSYGCSKTNLVDINVNPAPPDPGIRTKDSVCKGLSVKVKFHPSNYINYVWSSVPSGFSSNDSIINVSPSISTYYILKQTIPSTNCFRNDTIKIKVNPVPTPVIIGDTVICGTGMSTYKVTGATGDSYLWTVKAGKIITGQNTANLLVDWNALNMGQVKMTETNHLGCTKSDSIVANVSNKAKAGFGAQNACLGNPVYFHDSSLSSKSWGWNFGDSSVSTDENPLHIYAHPGTYKITQIVINSGGCYDTARKTVVVYPLPVLQWIIKKDTGRTILYDVSNNSYQQYLWTFGDGDQSSSYYGSHFYSKDDIYNLSLKVTNNYGCSEILDSSMLVDYIALGSIGIFPNPFIDHLKINYTVGENSEVSLALYDAIGKQVQSFFDQQQKAGYYSLNLTQIEPNLAPAMYFLKLTINGHVSVFKAGEGRLRGKSESGIVH